MFIPEDHKFILHGHSGNSLLGSPYRGTRMSGKKQIRFVFIQNIDHLVVLLVRHAGLKINLVIQ